MPNRNHAVGLEAIFFPFIIVGVLLQFGQDGFAQSDEGQFERQDPLGALQVGGGFATALQPPLFGCTDVPVAPLGGDAGGRIEMQWLDSDARGMAPTGIPFPASPHLGGHEGRKGQAELSFKEGGVSDEHASSDEKRGAREEGTGRQPIDGGQSPVGLDVAFISGLTLCPTDHGEAQEEEEEGG